MTSNVIEDEYKKHYFEEHICVFSKLTVELLSIMLSDASCIHT